MKLSIIIVNYNVRHFLKLCLQSVYRAIGDIPAEVLVVDNNSADDSVSMVRREFPEVKLIANFENTGFSKANNQAIKIAGGEYVLLLNPDTVVEENTFQRCISFMDQHPDAGALGIKMIDGKANYLPESKRGLPTPWVAFYKIFGMASIFPRSPKYARYYLGHLNPDENHEVEILAGAFMLIRRKAVEKAGLLDEAFFMYGEDIDLSYRICLEGFKNYYFADSQIIHYKGESTKKGSLNYVYIFYKAMAIFARKHFRGTYAGFFGILISIAIYLRAAISALKRIAKAVALPLLDMIILLGGLFYIKEYWENNHRFVVGGEYSWDLISVAFPLYALGWIGSIFLSGGYSRPARMPRLIQGILLGSLAIIVVYSLLSEEFRFSRAILLLGAMWALIAIPLSRMLLQKLTGWKMITSTASRKRALIVGSFPEYQRVEQILKQSDPMLDYVAFAGPQVNEDTQTFPIDQLTAVVNDLVIDEVIFCVASMSFEEILKQMELLRPLGVEIKIAPEASNFVVGSNSIDEKGVWYGEGNYQIAQPSSKRAKRAFDLIAAFVLLILSPLLIWFIPGKFTFFKNIMNVLKGNYTWVSYAEANIKERLPSLRKGVLGVDSGKRKLASHSTLKAELNKLYAINYSVYDDLNLVVTNLRRLGGEG